MEHEDGLLLTPRERAALERMSSAEINSEGLAEHESPKIGGWLFLLIFYLVFLSPVLTAIWALMVLPEMGFSITSAPIGLWIGLAMPMVFGLLAGGLLLLRREPETIPIAILCLWLSGPVSAIIIAQDGSAAIRAAAVAGIWTAYLLRSRRVDEVYNRDYSCED